MIASSSQAIAITYKEYLIYPIACLTRLHIYWLEVFLIKIILDNPNTLSIIVLVIIFVGEVLF